MPDPEKPTQPETIPTDTNDGPIADWVAQDQGKLDSLKTLGNDLERQQRDKQAIDEILGASATQLALPAESGVPRAATEPSDRRKRAESMQLPIDLTRKRRTVRVVTLDGNIMERYNQGESTVRLVTPDGDIIEKVDKAKKRSSRHNRDYTWPEAIPAIAGIRKEALRLDNPDLRSAFAKREAEKIIKRLKFYPKSQMSEDFIEYARQAAVMPQEAWIKSVKKAEELYGFELDPALSSEPESLDAMTQFERGRPEAYAQMMKEAKEFLIQERIRHYGTRKVKNTVVPRSVPNDLSVKELVRQYVEASGTGSRARLYDTEKEYYQAVIQNVNNARNKALSDLMPEGLPIRLSNPASISSAQIEQLTKLHMHGNVDELFKAVGVIQSAVGEGLNSYGLTVNKDKKRSIDTNEWVKHLKSRGLNPYAAGEPVARQIVLRRLLDEQIRNPSLLDNDLNPDTVGRMRVITNEITGNFLQSKSKYILNSSRKERFGRVVKESLSETRGTNNTHRQNLARVASQKPNEQNWSALGPYKIEELVKDGEDAKKPKLELVSNDNSNVTELKPKPKAKEKLAKGSKAVSKRASSIAANVRDRIKNRRKVSDNPETNSKDKAA